MLQVFGQPSFEVIEYLLMDDTASLLSVKNCLARFFGSLVYVITLSFLAALLPGALPNVAAVIGAVCYVSLVRPRSALRLVVVRMFSFSHSRLAAVQRAAHSGTPFGGDASSWHSQHHTACDGGRCLGVC